MNIVVESPESAWDIATAIGTIAAALATAGAVIVALVIAGKDRRSAEANLQAQLDANRRETALEHEVGLLLRLQDEIAEYEGFGETKGPAADISRSRIRGLLYALPDNRRLPATRATYLPDLAVRMEGDTAVRQAHPKVSKATWSESRFHQKEIAKLIHERMSDRTVGSSGDSPDEDK